MVTIYNDNILLPNMCMYILYNNIEYNTTINNNSLHICDKDTYVFYHVLFP